MEARRQWVAWDLQEPEAMAAATSLMRAHQLILAAVDAALRPYELTFARFEVLMLLTFSRHGALPLGVIGDRLMVHPTSVTNLVDKLEAGDLVERQADPTDRRRTLARLTANGRERAADAVEAVTAMRFGVRLPDAACDGLTATLTQLRVAYDDFNGSERLEAPRHWAPRPRPHDDEGAASPSERRT